jgi:hypothetical protein
MLFEDQLMWLTFFYGIPFKLSIIDTLYPTGDIANLPIYYYFGITYLLVCLTYLVGLPTYLMIKLLDDKVSWLILLYLLLFPFCVPYLIMLVGLFFF